MNEVNEGGDDPLVGRVVAGKYVVTARIGSGAMGAVYRAEQKALRRVVALKVMHREIASDPSFGARFHREAHAASRLVHPNSVLVTDFGEEPDGLLYLVMEYVAGRDVEHVIQRESPVSEARAVDILSQVLSALAVAHDFGVVHRDLKPENILIVDGVDDDGNVRDVVKVCDFGIASLMGEREAPLAEIDRVSTDRKLTRAGTFVGTPAYMSPEQVQGRSSDARSDLYSLGVVLFELLTGRLPFDASSPEIMLLHHVEKPPPSPQEFSACGDEIARICLRLLAKDPAARYASARALRAELRSIAGRGSSASVLPATPRRPATSTLAASETRVDDPAEAASRWRSLPALGAAMIIAAAMVTAFVLAPRVDAANDVQLAPISAAPMPATSAWIDTPSALGAADPLERASLAPLAVEVRPARVETPPSVASAARPAKRESAPVAVSALEPKSIDVAVVAPPVVVSVEAPARAPAPVPPAAVASAVVVAAPTFSAARARVSTSVERVSGTSRALVSSLLSRTDLGECYRTSLVRVGRPEGGPGTARLDIDEDGIVRTVGLSLPGALAEANACITAALAGRRLAQPPDTGGATAELQLLFEPL